VVGAFLFLFALVLDMLGAFLKLTDIPVVLVRASGDLSSHIRRALVE